MNETVPRKDDSRITDENYKYRLRRKRHVEKGNAIYFLVC